MAVIDYRDPSLTLIDTATDKASDYIALQGMSSAFKPRYTPDGSMILVCNQGQGQVNIVHVNDLHGHQDVLQVGKDPMGFAISADGNTALVANHGDGSVSVIDLKAAKVVRTFMGGTGIETLTYF